MKVAQMPEVFKYNGRSTNTSLLLSAPVSTVCVIILFLATRKGGISTSVSDVKNRGGMGEKPMAKLLRF